MKGSDQEITIDSLFDLAMNRKWEEVVEVYRNHSWAHTAKLTKSEETALHVAVSNYHAEGIRCYECSIKAMIDSFSPDNLFEILSMRNDKGNTPLHLAAAVGRTDICELIASKNSDLIKLRNLKNETPLFVTAYHGKLQTFLCLHEIYTKDRESDESLCRGGDGNTILHSAISGEYFELAFQIISYYPKLVNSVNVDGETPLHVLAKKPNVFISSSHLGFYDSIICRCVFVDELKKQNYAPIAYKINAYGPKRGTKYPENYRTCINIVQFLWRPIWKSVTVSLDSCTTNQTDEENQHKAKDGEEKNKAVGYFPANYTTCILLFKFAMKVILTVLGLGFARIRKIQQKKQKHVYAIQILDEVIEFESSYKYDSNGQKPVQKFEPQYSGRIEIPDTPPPAYNLDKESNLMTDLLDKDQSKDKKEKDQNKSVKRDTPILIAANMGIPEMVEKILSRCPVAIQDLDSNGKNVLLLAAENRQVSVFDYLLKMKLPEYVFHQVDNNGNSILHLAAMLGELQPWHIPGAALQMQWELKWYKYVKRSIPYRSFAQNNKDETPQKIFSTTHESLVKEGTKWLIKTSESCSVVAALIAAVAFATSATVPGGLDQETGYPIMENHTAFDVFSISSLIALNLSITSLVFFLAIITSRCQEHDFKRHLPRKLLMGLTALFASIAAMLVSFCAGHTFILRDKLRLAAVPIYAIATIPVMFFAIAQLPLYFDLLRAACRKVPIRSYKVFYH